MRIKDTAMIGILSAILLIVQVGLGYLPNIELVSFLIIVYTQYLKKKVFVVIYVFAVLEMIIYGFGIWLINYFYVWTILAVITLVVDKIKITAVWVLISGIFGLCFGALCSIPYFFIGGFSMGISYWIAGIPYDLLHCAGNAVIMALLYRPAVRLFDKLVTNDLLRS